MTEIRNAPDLEKTERSGQGVSVGDAVNVVAAVLDVQGFGPGDLVAA